MKKIYKRKSLRRLAAAVCGTLVAGTLGFAPVLYANPILDSKDAAVSISGTTDMSINSSLENNVIKWVDFSIGTGEKVAFDTNNYLNYVTGSARSDILGTLTGGGSIYLVNPNGILIGDGATINVGNLYLSTRNLSEDVLNAFSTNGTNPLTTGNIGGDVINLGTLNANSITVEGKNITFKNVADVTKDATLENGVLTGGTQNTNVTLTANSTGEIHIGSAEGGASGYTTNGTTYNYKLVSTKEELQNMKNNLAGNYMLAKDIDMSGIGNFTPIGNSNNFNGKFDGLGHTLSNLVINKENGSYIGLFGVAGSGSVIENLKLSGGSMKGYSQVGLVGFNLGTVRRVYNDGVSVEGQAQVGGIVGQNEGTVTQVWNKGAVSGTTQVGGIVGLNSGGTVEIAYNAGSVNGIAGSYSIAEIGGIVGQNINGSVKNVYNTGNVSASDGSKVGGIVGSNTKSVGKTATVSYAYNTGDVSAENGSNEKGIVGFNSATDEHTYDKPNDTTAFDGWTIDKDGTNSTAVWRQYGNNLPLLTAFLTRKDNITSTTEYNGGADVGATYTATTYSGTEAQNGYNYIKDVSIVTPKDLTVSFGASPAKTYDGTTEATAGTATLDGIVNSDAVSLADGVTANFADKNAGANKTVNYTGLALTGDKAKNYNLLNAATATGTGTITAKQLTATFADIAKTYDGTTNATAGQGTLAGVVASDEGKVSVSGLAAYDTKNAGTRTVNYTNVALSGAEATNYTIADTATGSGTISKADVKISVDNYSRAYDGTTDASGATLKTVDGAIFAGDTLSGGTLAFTDKNAGTGKTITVADVTVNDGNGGNNYNVTYEAGTGTITAKEITATFADIAKTYDGTTNATAGQGTLAGVVAGDTGKVSVSGLAAYDTKNAGTRTVNYTNVALSGAEAANYTIADTATGSGTISKADVKISVDNYSRAYDGTTDASGATLKTVDGTIFTGDTLSGGTLAFTDKNAGTGKTITVADVNVNDGNGGNNYNVTYESGTGTITAKEITATFADIAKTYDGTTNATAGQGTLAGVVENNDVNLATGLTAAYADKNAGTNKTVNYAGLALSGTDAGNYTIGTTAEGKGTITAKQLTATFADIAKTYDGTTNATTGQGTLTGVETIDEGKVSVSSGLAAYDTKNAGTRTVNYTNVALSGAEAANYTIADTATGSGTISKADVKISVDNYSRAYDGTTDASGATLKTVDGTIFAGDTLSGGTFAFTDKNAGTGKTITVSDVTVNDGNGGNNYNVTYQEGTGEITRRPLSLTANPVSITQGEAVPSSFSGTLTGFAEGEGLADGDSYAFNLSGTPTAVGKYAITGTLSIGDNDPAESGDYGTNYTFANAAANATAFTIAAKYVPPAPTPTPSAPSGGNGGNTGNTGGNTGSTTPTNPTTPIEPTPIAPSGNTDGTTPNSGGNTSGTGANTPTPLAAAERVIVAAVTETETIAAAATAGATAEMSHIADNVRPMSLTEQPTNSGENAAAAPLAAAVETAANAQDFTLTAGGLLAVSNETNSAPKDAMSVESIGHALSVLQHGSGEKGAATAPNTETKSAAGSIGSLDEAVEATDLAIGTEIAETDRESKAGQENLASDTGTAGGADESAEESDEKKKR